MSYPTISMTTPFEIFRTPIEYRQNVNGSYINGLWTDGSTVKLSTVLITGNKIDITLNGIALPTVNFTTTSENTLYLIQVALTAQPNILLVSLSDTNSLTITVMPILPNLSIINSFVVSGGATQATATIKNSPNISTITASIQPVTGEELLSLPEARREKEVYKMYTSTPIQTVGTANPDQVSFFGKVFEVYEVKPWQNNSIFTKINNFCYFIMRIQPLARQTGM